MIAVSQYTPQATAAAVYYLIHSTLVGGGAVPDRRYDRARRGDLWLRLAPVMPGNGIIASCISSPPSLSPGCRRCRALSASCWSCRRRRVRRNGLDLGIILDLADRHLWADPRPARWCSGNATRCRAEAPEPEEHAPRPGPIPPGWSRTSISGTWRRRLALRWPLRPRGCCWRDRRPDRSCRAGHALCRCDRGNCMTARPISTRCWRCGRARNDPSPLSPSVAVADAGPWSGCCW